MAARRKDNVEIMTIALLDDVSKELHILLEMLTRRFREKGTAVKIDTFSCGEEFFKVFRPGCYDFILLDIYMDKMSGIDVARKIREQDKEVCLAFCTTSNDFASESYQVNAMYYLRKPISREGVDAMLERLNLSELEQKRQLFLPDGQKVILRNIMYTEYYNHVVTIHNQIGDNIQTRISHNELEKMLCVYSYFFCCSRGVIVNFYGVSKHKKDMFVMKNGGMVPISRRKAKEVGDAYTKFLFERMRSEVCGSC